MPDVKVHNLFSSRPRHKVSVMVYRFSWLTFVTSFITRKILSVLSGILFYFIFCLRVLAWDQNIVSVVISFNVFLKFLMYSLLWASESTLCSWSVAWAFMFILENGAISHSKNEPFQGISDSLSDVLEQQRVWGPVLPFCDHTCVAEASPRVRKTSWPVRLFLTGFLS